MVAVLLLGLLGGCFGGGGLDAEPLPPGPSPSASAPGLGRFYDQVVDWRECRVTMQCAELTVPLDYDDPTGRTITLSLLKVPAEDPDRRIGAVLVNPGGPGVPGIDYAARAAGVYGEDVRASYDIVGFDPRGVGASTPLECATDARRDRLVSADPSPDSTAELRAGVAQIGRLGRDCLAADAGLTRHISTKEQARDVDVIRAAALGQERLVWYGASYGTYLGAWYAEQFPDRVGRMVLDGAVDPDLGVVETALAQAKGLEGALRAYAAACVARGSCYLGDSVDAATQRVDAFLEGLDAEPLRFGDRRLTEGLAVQAIWGQLYLQQTWSLLDRSLGAALEGNAAALIAFADQWLSRGPDGYLDNSLDAYYAISCRDHEAGPAPAEAEALESRFVEVAPTFGPMLAASTAACHDWPLHGPPPRPLRAQGAAPILVIGTSGDPATPLAWAEALSEQLASATLVRREGEGHVGYRKGNDCVDDIVDRYLVSGEVPAGTVDC